MHLVSEFSESRAVLFATAGGTVKRTSLDQFTRPALRRRGGHLARARATGWRSSPSRTARSEVVLAASGGRAIRFGEGDIPLMGRATQGVRGMKLDAQGAAGGAGRPASRTPTLVRRHGARPGQALADGGPAAAEARRQGHHRGPRAARSSASWWRCCRWASPTWPRSRRRGGDDAHPPRRPPRAAPRRPPRARAGAGEERAHRRRHPAGRARRHRPRHHRRRAAGGALARRRVGRMGLRRRTRPDGGGGGADGDRPAAMRRHPPRTALSADGCRSSPWLR